MIKKALRASISDLICKGINPKYYFISFSGKNKHFAKKNISKIKLALKQEQKKYNITLSGGDISCSKYLSITISSIGYSKSLPILRNGAKNNDDIYITNTIGDAFVGLKVLKKKIKLSKKSINYFIKKFYLPNLPFKFSRKIHLLQIHQLIFLMVSFKIWNTSCQILIYHQKYLLIIYLFLFI